jgi:DNA-binding transcriptional MerR regulator
MLRIGEFSALSQISIYMLRHYDEIGLLIPENIDKFTGYRYYSETQLPIANKIRVLKSMGLSLPLIKEILTNYAEDCELKTYLETQAVHQKEKIELMQRQLTLIESTIRHLEHPSPIPSYSVTLKEFAQHNVISYRQIITTPDQEGILWVRLAEETKSLNLHYTNPQWNIAIFHDGQFIEENLDVEVQKSVGGIYQDIGLAKFKTVDAIVAATLTFKGHYMNLPVANEAIARWIVDNHYKISGPHFNIYHISPETESSFADMITEVCFPVQSE